MLIWKLSVQFILSAAAASSPHNSGALHPPIPSLCPLLTVLNLSLGIGNSRMSLITSFVCGGFWIISQRVVQWPTRSYRSRKSRIDGWVALGVFIYLTTSTNCLTHLAHLAALRRRTAGPVVDCRDFVSSGARVAIQVRTSTGGETEKTSQFGRLDAKTTTKHKVCYDSCRYFGN